MKKPRMNTKISRVHLKMLLNVAVCHYVELRYLLATSDKLTAYRAVDRAVSLEQMKEYTLEYRHNNNVSRTKYYCITKKGLRYLMEQGDRLPDNFAWIRYLKVPGNRIVSRGYRLHQEEMQRYLAISGTAYLMLLLPSAASPIFASSMRGEEIVNMEDQDRGKKLEAIVDDAKLSYAHLGREESEGAARPPLEFTNVFEIKQVLVEMTSRKEETYAGRYTGILETAEKSVLVYIGNRKGMAWSATATKPEFKAHHQFVSYKRSGNLRGDENHAILFVSNEHMLFNLYTNKYSRKFDESFALGKGFTSFTVFPVSDIGLSNLKDFMKGDVNIVYNEIIEQAVESGLFIRNEKNLRSTFPLVGNAGDFIAMGTFMDMVKVNRITEMQRTMPDKSFGLICYDWQASYYQRIAPQLNYYTIGN